MTDLRFSIPAVLVVAACAIAVGVRAGTARSPEPRRGATNRERASMAASVAGSESAWLTEVTQNFPGDHWSQRDDFHGREYRHLIELADQHRVRLEDVIRAVDDDLHESATTSPDAPDPRAARAVPCKPRPFYD
ncbi:MAG: hypothetical protein KIT84_04115 [Labilithrix sp.]|nr:hypothetical protein [Labilithrix sp.]MCW5810171.1 hypothetical protein [Labilithrix sp.]